MNSISKNYLRALGLSLVGALLLTVSCGSPQQMRQASDTEVNFSERKTYSLTGGDTEEAGLTGFKRDSFRAFFNEALNEILAKRGLTEVGESETDSADYIIRYILRDVLVINALDPDSRRLIWRGQSDTGLAGVKLSQSAVTNIVEQAIGGFPPQN